MNSANYPRRSRISIHYNGRKNAQRIATQCAIAARRMSTRNCSCSRIRSENIAAAISRASCPSKKLPESRGKAISSVRQNNLVFFESSRRRFPTHSFFFRRGRIIHLLFVFRAVSLILRSALSPLIIVVSVKSTQIEISAKLHR